MKKKQHALNPGQVECRPDLEFFKDAGLGPNR